MIEKNVKFIFSLLKSFLLAFCEILIFFIALIYVSLLMSAIFSPFIIIVWLIVG